MPYSDDHAALQHAVSHQCCVDSDHSISNEAFDEAASSSILWNPNASGCGDLRIPCVGDLIASGTFSAMALSCT